MSPSSPTIDASLGVADYTDVTNVQLASVIFEDFYSAARFELTTSWVDNDCKTTSWLDATSTEINTELCIHSSAESKALLASTAAFCSGFVKSVQYTVKHATDLTANITSVTASVVISDVPMTVLQTGEDGVTQVGFVFTSDWVFLSGYVCLNLIEVCIVG